MSEDRIKLSIDEQIDWMEYKRGIQFSIIDKKHAKQFLENNTYFFKLKAFSKNYTKYKQTEKEGQYCGIDFAYLVELSTLDSLLRKIIIKIALDIEHFLKVRLIKLSTYNEGDNGYNIVEEFLGTRPDVKTDIEHKHKNSACNELIETFSDKFALWNIVEVLSFGNFIELYKFYIYHFKIESEEEILNNLFAVKMLRNAAAHNNCLIHNLILTEKNSINPNKNILVKVSKIQGIPRKSVDKKMSHKVINDFVVMLYIFDKVVTSQKCKEHTYIELYNFFNDRMKRNKDYFEKNEILTSTFNFVNIIVTNFYNENCLHAPLYNKTEILEEDMIKL